MDAEPVSAIQAAAFVLHVSYKRCGDSSKPLGQQSAPASMNTRLEYRRDTDPGIDRLYPLPRQKLTNSVRQDRPDKIRSRPHTQDAQRLQPH